MRTRIYTIVLAALAIIIGSCSDFLEVKPKESVSDDQTIFDAASALTAVLGAYNGLANGGYYGTSFQSIGYLAGDNIVWTGSQSQVQEFINHNVKADNATISATWVAIYRTINRANNVLAKLPEVKDPSLTNALRNQYLGEAYFLRALSYFDLARVWGGVPIVTEPTLTPTDNSSIAKATVDAVYAQVLSDLQKAEPLLPATTNRYRATRKTVWSLLSRFYLYRNDDAKAVEYASKVIDDAANYKLLKPYQKFFADTTLSDSASTRGTQESVFEIFYNGTTEQNGHRGQWQPQTNGGTRQWAPNNTLVTLLKDPLIGGNRSVLVAKDNQGRWYGNLYYRTPASDPSYVIRIAELYLIRAEARAKQEDLSGAISDLDAVRDRADLAGTTATTKEEILLAIENERRVEFALEPHRWFDLVRTGRAQAVLGITDPNKLVLPLPTDQLLVDKALKQNDGY